MTAKQRDDRDRAEAEMAGNGTVTKTHVDPETVRAYNEYLKDWRWNMSTHITLQREYMGRKFAPRNENLF